MIYTISVILLIIAIIIFKISGNFLKAFFTSALGGVGALCAVWAVNFFVPLSLGVNLFSLVFSVLFSVPGVIFLLVCKTFLF